VVTVNPAVEAMGGYALEELRHRVAALRAAGQQLHDFSIGDPDEPTPAFIRQALVDALGPVSRYPTSLGQAGLRQAVVDFLARRHGVTGLDPDVHVLPTAGSKEAIFHLPFSVVDPGGERRHVLWGDPGYPVYDRGATLAGGVSDPVTLTAERGWRLDLTSLPDERLARACLAWINYPHNPTGATVDLGWLRDQVACARAHDVLLASDECYQEVWFDHPAPSVLEACDGDLAGVVAVLSLSKRSGMTGYRSGALVGDPTVVGMQRTVRPNFGTASQDFVQAAATAAWGDQDHVDERRAVFAAKRDVVLGFLEEVGIEVSGSTATFYVWFRAPGGDDVAYAEALLDAGVVASPGRSFGPAGAGWLRLALVPTVEACRAAVDGWGRAIEDGALPG
jgi:succinyldiaminopimelate transaminase